jgi:hypothetical protein
VKKPEIGFDRTLQLEWLDRLAGLVAGGAGLAAAREAMREHLSVQLPGREGVEKSVRVLMRPWFPSDRNEVRLRDEAAGLVGEVPAEERFVVHWGLLLVAYPFFRDTVAAIGRLAAIEPSFTAVGLRRRLIERYGDREIVERSRRHIVTTLLAWGRLRTAGAHGAYALEQPIAVRSPRLQAWFVEAMLRAYPGTPFLVDQLQSAPAAFPIRFGEALPITLRDPRFKPTVEGARTLTVTLCDG